MGLCCMAQETQTGALCQPGGVGWGARLSPIRVGSGRGKPAPRTPEAGRWMCSSSRGEDVGWAFPPGPGRAGLGEELVDDTHLHAVILVCATAWPRHLLGCGPR